MFHFDGKLKSKKNLNFIAFWNAFTMLNYNENKLWTLINFLDCLDDTIEEALPEWLF